jgi:hypothetical protein
LIKFGGPTDNNHQTFLQPGPGTAFLISIKLKSLGFHKAWAAQNNIGFFANAVMVLETVTSIRFVHEKLCNWTGELLNLQIIQINQSRNIIDGYLVMAAELEYQSNQSAILTR